MQSRSLRVAALGVLLSLCAAAAANSTRWGADYFPNVQLTNQNGKTVRFYDDLLKGKIVAMYLMYTTCAFNCPLETARVAQAQKLLGDRVGKDIYFYSISIDPIHDTPSVLKAYAERYHAGPGWQFLTGKPADIDLISKKLGLYSPPNPANKDGHTPFLLIGNVETGQWMRNSALDNPKFLAIMIGQTLDSWQHRAGEPLKSYANASDLKLAPGQYLFATKCAACHTVGGGDRTGPDLLGVTQRHDRAWLVKYMQKPDELLAAGDPVASALFRQYKEVRMPNLNLSEADAEDLLGYIDRKVLYYVDPMHPAYKSAKPGTSPDCGMRLQPVFEE